MRDLDESGSFKSFKEKQNGPICCLEKTLDNNYLITLDKYSSLNIWNLKNGNLVKPSNEIHAERYAINRTCIN